MSYSNIANIQTNNIFNDYPNDLEQNTNEKTKYLLKTVENDYQIDVDKHPQLKADLLFFSSLAQQMEEGMKRTAFEQVTKNESDEEIRKSAEDHYNTFKTPGDLAENRYWARIRDKFYLDISSKETIEYVGCLGKIKFLFDFSLNKAIKVFSFFKNHIKHD